ncbi:MAG: autotransporter-associated beta strand repeat-containing protein, partial [Mycobacterium sp.]|nr:autotransporter-associated beta strand repeat-containing protein [Mycobacterium sp.]
LPGYILPTGGSITISGTISNATLANGVLDGSKTGTFDQSTTFASFNGLRGLNLGSVTIGSSAPGFIMQLGADLGGSVTLSGSNTYTGGTTILAGTLNITSDAALGAASPVGAIIDSTNIASSIYAANGIVFNSLTEGNGTLQISPTVTGTLASPFVLDRPIAVDGEIATINPNGNVVKLTGEIISLGGGGTGIGNATGVSDLSINGTGTVIVAPTNGSNPYFYGNWIVTKGTLMVSSDAALGNTTGASYTIGQIDLNGGTFQAGASFSSVRSLFLGGGSTFDTNGFTTSFAGSMTDVQRTLDITNSSTTTAGAVTFGSLVVGGTATLQLAGGTAGETVTLTNGITRQAGATLILQPSTSSSLGTSTEQLFSPTQTVTNGIVAPWIVTNNGVAGSAGPYDFVTYGANGYVKATYGATVVSSATGTTVVDETANQTLAANAAAYALKVESGKTITLSGNTLTLGDGTNPAGLSLAAATPISGGTLAFGGSEAVIWLGTASTINSIITGTGGLTVAGSGSLTLTGASSSLTGPIYIDSGTLTLATANYFTTNPSITLADTKSKPAAATFAISASNTVAALNSVGNNSKVTISGATTALTIGDASNLNSTLSATITQSGGAVVGALTKNGSGLLDISGGAVTLATGSTVVVNGGILRIANGVFGTSATNVITLGSGTELQYAGNGGSKFNDPIQGSGMFHLIGGTVQLTSTSNTYSGGTLVEAGSTLDLTTANVSSGNANIANAGGLVVFDQATSGTYSGVISDGREMGTGTLMSGSLVKDDSTGANSGNVTLSAVQTYTGGTFVEAGTLTLGVQDAIAASSGVDLGRVGGPAGTGAAAANGPVTATLALGADNTIQGLMNETGNNTAVLLNGHTLTIANANSNVWTFSGLISGTGSLVKSGPGTELLTGASTYSGPTTVNGGLLSLSDTGSITSQVAVNAGGTLGGSGSVGATTVASGGTLAPGSFTKALTVGGNLAFASGALYAVAVSPSAATETVVTGTASLRGTVLATFQSGSYTQIPKSYTILTSAGLGGSTFNTFTTASMPAGLQASLTYSATDVILNLTSGLGRVAGLASNQIAVGNTIDASFNGSGSGFTGGFATLLGLPAYALPAALAQVSGESNANMAQAGRQAMTSFLSLLLNPFVEARGAGFGPAMGFAPERPALSPEVASAYAAVGA